MTKRHHANKNEERDPAQEAHTTVRDAPPIGAVAYGDNLEFMSSLPDGCCDLVYADPPFNAGRVLGPPKSGRHQFEDRHEGGISGYFAFLRPRLVHIRRLLTVRGTLYVHLDYRSVHYVKVMLDELFGVANFVNEIIWSYRSGGRPARWFPRKHDTLLVYAKQKGLHTFNRLRGGTYRTQDLKRDADGRPYKQTREGRIYFHPDGPIIGDVWDIPILSTVSRERTGYPTQKPEALLERVVRASTNESDVVGDFFCGSGTTLAVAARLGRRWMGCDSHPDAVAIARARLATLHRPARRAAVLTPAL